jgi:ribosomal protein S27AE
MPMNRKLYPIDWEKISARIRHERAKDKCERCGVAEP